jgi:hypothetical protein
MWYYEEVLPFYHQLLAEWHKVVERWAQGCRAIVTAHHASTPEARPGCSRTSLTQTSAPWTEAFVESLYRQAQTQAALEIWPKTGRLSQWVAQRFEAEAILDNLREATAEALRGLIMMPVEQALLQQLPERPAQAQWLEGLLEQARPFWRYDEALLAEMSRRHTRLDRWFLLPQGEASPLAALIQQGPDPPAIIASREPSLMAVVTVRRIYG